MNVAPLLLLLLLLLLFFWLLLFRPSRRRRSTEAPSKHAQRKGNKLARTGRESSPGPFRRRQNPRVPGGAKKAKKIEFVHFNIKQKQESAVNTPQNSLCARNALRHQARARICGKYDAKRSRTERAPQSGTKAFSLTVRTP